MKDAINTHGGPRSEGPHSLEELLSHGDWLRRLAGVLVGPGPDAQDLVQDTLLTSAGSAPPAGVELRAWIAGIARNLARTRGRSDFRRAARERGAARQEGQPSTLDQVTSLERQRDLLNALMLLPESQRQAVLSRYYDGWPPRKIADELGIPVATAKSRIQRGLAGLREQLDASYGDRRTWMLAFLPVARPASKVAATGGFAKGAIAATVLIAGLAGWAVTSPTAWGVADLGATQHHGAAEGPVAEPAPEAEVALLDPVERRRDENVRLAVESRDVEDRFRVRAVDGTTGREIPNISGLSLGMERALENRPRGFSSIEDVKWLGEPLETDDDGRTWVRGTPPLMIYAEDGERQGYGVLADPAPGVEEVVIRLDSTVALDLVVVDRLGKPVDFDAPVIFEALLPEDPAAPLTADGYPVTPGPLDWYPQRRLVRNGHREIRFLDHMVKVDRPVFPARHARLRAFFVDVPGLVEFAPELVAYGDTERAPTRAGTATVELVAPETGGVTLEIRDARGALVDAQGDASLRWSDVPSGRYPERYGAPIRGGVAEWPQVIAGVHALSIDVSLPTLGQSWTLAGEGPRAAGDIARLETTLPSDPVIALRVEDTAGEPLSFDRAWLLFGERSPVWWNQTIRAVPDGEARLTFPIPGDVKLSPPYAIEIEQDHPKGARRARHRFHLTPEEALFGAELPTARLDLEEPMTVRGRLVDPGGDPVTGALVSLSRLGGPGASCTVEADGTFELRACFGTEETLRVHVFKAGEDERLLDREAPPQVECQVRPAESTEPIEVLVDFTWNRIHAAVHTAPLTIDPTQWTLGLRKADSANFRAFLPGNDPGSWFFEGAEPGVYTAELRIGGFSLQTWPDITVPEASDVYDPRLQSIALDEYVREIRIHWKEPRDPSTGARKPFLEALVFDDRGERVTGLDADALWVPVGDAHDHPLTLVLSANGYLPETILLTDVGSDLAVDLAPGIPATLTLRGATPLGAQLVCELVSEPGNKDPSPSSTSLRLPRALEDGSVVSVSFPSPGRYELLRHVIQPSGRTQRGSKFVEERTGQTFEILDPLGELPAGMGPGAAKAANQRIVLRPGLVSK